MGWRLKPGQNLKLNLIQQHGAKKAAGAKYMYLDCAPKYASTFAIVSNVSPASISLMELSAGENYLGASTV